MKLSSIVNKDSILLELKGTDKKSIISELVEVLFQHQGFGDEGVSREEVIEALLERENDQTTAVGEGFAFPHARFPNVHRFYMVVGVCREGMDFDSMDKKPSQFFVLNIVAQSKANVLLQARAAIMRFMMPPDVQKLLLTAENSSEVWKKLDESGVEINNDILAKDIMRPAVATISSKATLKEAALLLHKHHIDALPVLNESGEFTGDLTAFDLFSFGIPSFFFNLKKISFVKHMDPFEKYFKADNDILISEMDTKRKAPRICADTTLIEIIFEFTTNNQQVLYVVEDQKLLGIIDRFSIVDKILVAED
ncbi:MAG: PTS sugar transporter subunit IIA [Lentisphaeria bacterium]|nr:PTS sugar transporter subunit IIA [Lentisphaeria bacterium]